jgi:hypothetical protein
MAEETSTDLMGRLTGLRVPGADRSAELPARRDERTPSDEPVDPGDRREITTRGRTPAEVLGDREEPSEPQPSDDGGQEAAPQPTARGRKAVKKFKYRGQELTAEEILDKGYLEALVTTAEQFPNLQRKHQQLLEDVATLQLSKKPQEAQPTVTPEQKEQSYVQHIRQISKAYEELAKREVALYVKEGLIESDLPEAYEKAVTSLFAILLYHIDVIQTVASRTDAAVEWIAAEREIRSAVKTKSILDQAIDKVAARKDKVYEGLKDPDTRAEFVEWLKKDVDPKVGSINEKTIGDLWIAFNAEAVLEFAKAGQEEPKPRRNALASGDGSTARPGGVEEAPKEKSVMDRMIEMRLPAEQ